MKKSVLREYAKLIISTGLNVQKGQDVLIYAELDQPEFVKMLVEEAYKRKANQVTVEWHYQPLDKIHVRGQSLKTLGTVTEWEKARQEHYCKTFPCQLHLISEDPDGLKGMNTEKLAKAKQMKYPILKPYRDRRENQEQWCIAAVPGVAWAKKMFPDLPKGKAMEKLWEAILQTARVTDDPIAAWEAHNKNMEAKAQHMNSLGITSLHYKADNGTDFTVGMIPEAIWRAALDTSLQGISFNPNIPTEEVFISPMKGKAEGIVYATMPLSYQGQLIDKFWIRFENGRAVESGAETGADLLHTMLNMDEGSALLGECALVPQSSPIAKSGLLFYNTLFDENASCHLAVGAGFPDTIKGFEDKTLEECREMGINESMIHVDFMIGCDSMSIDGITADGTEIPVFRSGDWAF